MTEEQFNSIQELLSNVDSRTNNDSIVEAIYSLKNTMESISNKLDRNNELLNGIYEKD